MIDSQSCLICEIKFDSSSEATKYTIELHMDIINAMDEHV